MKAKILFKRNDPFMNSHNKHQMWAWRANFDLSIILDAYACATYLAKYIAKAEKKSDLAQEMVQKITEDMENNAADLTHTGKTLINKLMMGSLSQRDITAQEVAHRLLQIPMCRHPQHEFVDVMLNSGNSFHNFGNDLVIGKNIYLRYAERKLDIKEFPEIENMNLDTCRPKLQIFKGKTNKT